MGVQLGKGDCASAQFLIMAIFRCKRSGNTVEFTLPQDIEELRKHEGYDEVREEKTTEEVVRKKPGPKPKLPDFLQTSQV